MATGLYRAKRMRCELPRELEEVSRDEVAPRPPAVMTKVVVVLRTGTYWIEGVTVVLVAEQLVRMPLDGYARFIGDLGSI